RGIEPAPVAVAGVLPPRTQAQETLETAPQGRAGVMAALDPLKVGAHPLPAPALVLGRLGDLVPIFGQAADRDHGVVDRAAADALRPRVKDAPLITAGVLR